MNFLSSNIKHLRKVNRLSAKQLADKLKTSEEKIKQAEKRSEKVSLELVLSFCKYFGISIQSLVNVDLEVKEKKAKNIKLIVFDIDGVLTDAGMYYSESGDEFKKFNAKDGLAIKRLTKKGVIIGFLSNGINEKLIKSRAELLGVQKVYVGTKEKLDILDQWVKELRIGFDKVAYIGDDENDLKLMKKVGFTACPADAVDSIKMQVHVVLSRNGGDACAREWIDSYF